MDATELARRYERQRLFWVELAPGKRVQMKRPLLDESREFATDFSIAKVAQFLHDWDGIVESDVLAGSDSTSPVEFNKAFATTVLRDNIDWAQKVLQAVADVVSERAKTTTAVEKKPETS